jgi:hypothetical protein
MFLIILIICAILFFGWMYFSQRGRDIELLRHSDVNLEMEENNQEYEGLPDEKGVEEKGVEEKGVEEKGVEEKLIPPTLPPTPPPRVNPTTDFMPSKSFAGERRGYVFKMDTKGIGYYADHYNPQKGYQIEGFRGESRGDERRHISFSDDEILLYSPQESPIETGNRNRNLNRTKI